jgi:hypothetical protein
MATEKDRQIIRQSQIKSTIDYFNMMGIQPTLEDVVKTTTLLEMFCVEGYSKEMIGRFEKLDQHIQEMYK